MADQYLDHNHREPQGQYSPHQPGQPPHGYEWVQPGNQFAMIAVTSGIIASIIASSAAR